MKISKKKSFAKRLNQLLDAADYPAIGDGRQHYVAKTFGVTGSCAQKWLSGESIPRYETVCKIVDHFKKYGATIQGLLYDDDQPQQINDSAAQYSASNVWRVPILSTISAGDLQECLASAHASECDTAPTTYRPRAHTFSLLVKGDSMEPLFSAGMYIIVEPDMQPEPGDYVVIRNGGDGTLKQLIKDGNDYYLKPLNPRYPIKPLDDAEIVGVVRETGRKFR